jgi:hypothetical protein
MENKKNIFQSSQPLSQSSKSSSSNKSTEIDKKIVEREKIEREVAKCLQDIDRKYYNPNFNLMGEIVNIFGDVNWDKVKLDIERLNKIDEKLDKVIKLIVDQHSEEFFKILGYVRQIQNMIESSKLKLSDARDLLRNINSIISNLSTGENSEWKLKSFYCSEIITKLNKTGQIFKIIQDCEVYIENSKIFDAINLLKKSHREHFEYDKEFRNFNFLVSINMRFEKIKENIEDKIITNLSNILFFYGENVLERKISSLLNYFLNFYSKISIDNELSKPLEKFMLVIKRILNNDLKDYNFDQESNHLDHYFNESVIDLDSEKKLSSLIYLIKCLKNYDNSFNIFIKFNEKLNENLNNLLERIVKITTDLLKTIEFTKYDLDNKVDKIKFLLFFQTFLMTIFHTLTKIVALNTYLKNEYITEIINKIYLSIEKLIILPLQVYNKISAPRSEGENNTSSSDSEFAQGESIVRMKINEILTNNIENLPILYKIFFKFSDFNNKLNNFKLNKLNETLNSNNSQLFAYYSKKIIPKKIFDINSFLTDYDGEMSNFKFISEFIFKINKLKELLTFSFENGFIELTKIFKEMFGKFNEETRTFIENIKSKCTWSPNFNSIYEELIKTKEFKEVSIKLDFKKYEKKIIDVEDINSKYSQKVNNLIQSMIFTSGSKTKDENLILISRNYKLMELITKFIYCTENLINIGENFIFELMKGEFSNAKMIAILEQVNSMHFMDLKDTKDTKDLPSLIMISLRIIEKLSSEVTKLIFTCKIEFYFLVANLVKNINKNEYWLHEPQMTPEYFITAFINDFNMYNSLFQYNLTGSEYDFICGDYLLLINNAFIYCLKNISSNSINNFGVNLLIRNFEFIKEKLGYDKNFKDTNFTKTIFYFPNYIRLLNCSEDNIEEELKKYYEIKPYEEEFISPLLNIRTNTRQTFNEIEKSKIIRKIFN